ncbi:MAG: ABC transporter ATP-binding protein [Steroidobacteraceae bacterium]
MWLEVAGATRRFDGRAALDGLDFGLAEGEIGCLLGPSGCGKTTTLRCIAGLETLDQGRILCRDELLSGPGIHRPAHRRGIGLVFQDHALFPHLSALGNVEFGLSQLPPAERRRRASELLERGGLADRLDAFPGQLSGGQQQRVALARALAPSPSLLLMDEPFANLDVALRERLVGELGALLRRTGTTALVVTHEQQDAFTLADRIGLMREGRLEQWATPYDLYHRPASRFAAEFIGRASFIPACCNGSGELQSELGPLREDSHATHCSGPVDVLLRPDDVVHDDDSPLKARIVERSFRGADFLYTLELSSGRRVLSIVPSHHDHRVGEAIGIRLDTDHVITFPAAG